MKNFNSKHSGDTMEVGIDKVSTENIIYANNNIENPSTNDIRVVNDNSEYKVIIKLPNGDKFVEGMSEIWLNASSEYTVISGILNAAKDANLIGVREGPEVHATFIYSVPVPIASFPHTLDVHNSTTINANPSMFTTDELNPTRLTLNKIDHCHITKLGFRFTHGSSGATNDPFQVNMRIKKNGTTYLAPILYADGQKKDEYGASVLEFFDLEDYGLVLGDYLEFEIDSTLGLEPGSGNVTQIVLKLTTYSSRA